MRKYIGRVIPGSSTHHTPWTFVQYTVCTNYIRFNVNLLPQAMAQAKPSCHWQLWPTLQFLKAQAVKSQAKAMAFRPSRAGTSLQVAIGCGRNWAGHEGCGTDNKGILRLGYAKDGCCCAERVAWIVIVTCHKLGTQQKYSGIFFFVFTNLCKGL